MVKLATSSHCPKCMMIKAALKKNSTPYEEIDAATITDELDRDGIFSLPAVKVGECWKVATLDTVKQAEQLD